MSDYLPPPPPISPFRTSFSFSDDDNELVLGLDQDMAKATNAVPRRPVLSQSSSTADPPILLSDSLSQSLPSSGSFGLEQQPSSSTSVDRSTTGLSLSSPVETWDNACVRMWLESLGMAHYARTFEQNHIVGDILLECDSQAIRALGIIKVGDRIKLERNLAELRAQHVGKKRAAGGPEEARSLHTINSHVVSPFAPSSSGYAASSPVDSYFKGSTVRQQTVLHSSSSGEVKNILSMDAVWRSTVKFIYDQGQSKTVNIQGCQTAEQVKLRALRKETVKVNMLSADTWVVHVADNELGTTTRQLSDHELMAICNSPDRKERRRLIICEADSQPSLKQLSKSQQILRDSLGRSDGRPVSAKSLTTSQELGDEDVGNATANSDDDETRTIFPDRRGSAATVNSETSGRQVGNLSGQRPPSELISSNLGHYFPEVRPHDLEKTIRNSIRFSRMSRLSARRTSVASSLAWGIPEKEEDIVPPVPQLPDMDYTNVNMANIGGTLTSRLASSANSSSVSLDQDEDATSTLTSGNMLRRPESIQSVKSVQSVQSIQSAHSLHSESAQSTRSSILRRSLLRSKRKSQEDAASSSGTSFMDALSTINPDTNSSRASEQDPDPDSLQDSLDSLDNGLGRATQIKWMKGRLIGSGSFGTVYLGMNSFTGELMAVKQVELPSSDDNKTEARKKSMVEALEREMALLRELEHENIVQYLGSNADGNYLNIFLEYVPGGSVATLLSSYGVFQESLIRTFVRQILQGLKYLHDRNIIHRDIKGANVLVDNKSTIKISDFGISKKIETNLLANSRVSLQGSVYWMAPEVVKQTSYTNKADIWSLGCLIVEMFTGTHPFPEFSQMQAIFKLGNSVAPTIPDHCSVDAKDFLAQAFATDYNQRPTAGELLGHPFLKPMIRP